MLQQQGIFISLEGIDGSGKTTLKEALLSKLAGQVEVITIREPGGTDTSEKIREVLLDVRNQGILARTEAMLYAAARCQLVEEVIKPALQAGKWVIADRFMDSTIAYQGYGRSLDLEYLYELNHLCTNGVVPDLTFLLDISVEEGCRRRKQDIPDRLEMEGFDFQERVRKGYLRLWKAEPGRIKRLDADRPADELLAESLQYMSHFQQINE